MFFVFLRLTDMVVHVKPSMIMDLSRTCAVVEAVEIHNLSIDSNPFQNISSSPCKSYDVPWIMERLPCFSPSWFPAQGSNRNYGKSCMDHGPKFSLFFMSPFGFSDGEDREVENRIKHIRLSLATLFLQSWF